MTTVIFTDFKDGFSVRISGHSGDSMICACCATLGYALINTLGLEAEQNKVIIDDVTITEGEMPEIYIRCRYVRMSRARIDGAVTTAFNGFIMLSEKYPDNVHIDTGTKK